MIRLLLFLVGVSVPLLCLGASDGVLNQDSIPLEQQLAEFVITSTRTDKTVSNTPVLTQVLTSRQIRQLDFENIQEALEYTVPGLAFGRDGRGSQIQVSGLESKYVLVLIDGERINRLPGGSVDFERLSLSNVRQVEIVRGASSALYGSNAIGMVINILTYMPHRPLEGWGRMRYGTYNDMSLDLGFGSQHMAWSTLTTIYHRGDKGYTITPQDQQNYTKNPYSITQVEQKIWWMKGGTTINAKANVSFGAESNPPQSIKSSITRHRNQTFNLMLEQDIATHLLTLSYHGDFFQRIREQIDDHTRSKDAGATLNTIRLTDYTAPTAEMELIFGVEYNALTDYNVSLFGPKSNTRSVYDINGFGQMEWQVSRALNVTTGVRYTHNSAFGNAVTPKVNLMYKIGDNWRLRMGYGRGFKAPNSTELYSDYRMGSVSHNIGNPDLSAETSNYLCASGEYRSGWLNVSVDAYYNRINNKIQSEFVQVDAEGTIETQLRYRNIADVALKGIQMNLDLFPTQKITGRLSYSYTDARDNKTNLQLKGNSHHALNGSVAYRASLWGHDAICTVAGRWRSNKINDIERVVLHPSTGEETRTVESNPQPAYSIWKISGQYTLWCRGFASAMLGLSVDNLFGFTDPIHFTTFDPGRRFFGTMTFRF